MLVSDPRPSAAAPLRTVSFVLLALAGPPAFVLVTDRLLGTSPGLGVQIALQVIYCALAAALVWSALRGERSSLASIGLRRPTWRTWLLAAGILVVVQFVLPSITTPVLQFFGTDGVAAGVQRLASVPAWLRVVMALTGGAIEELLYRGYATSRLVAITGSSWRGGVIAALAFGIAHVPAWGSAFALTADLPFGVFMTIVFLWRRDLTANILAHSAALVVGLLALR
jgi:membrane protease YdiL (CAAX protease family)